MVSEQESWILFDDDTEADIDIWIDAYGCETTSSEDAIAIVGRYSSGPRVGQFCLIDMRDFIQKELSYGD